LKNILKKTFKKKSQKKTKTKITKTKVKKNRQQIIEILKQLKLAMEAEI